MVIRKPQNVFQLQNNFYDKATFLVKRKMNRNYQYIHKIINHHFFELQSKTHSFTAK